MRCTNCEYRLWHIASRNCPECGQQYKPSDFEFVINSVQFCCPHCDKPYYGTGERGLLTPTEFDCVQCNQHIHIDEMVLRPAENVTEQQTQVDINPWLDRKNIGFFKAWFKMIGWAMTNPTRLIQSTSSESSIPQAMWYLTFTAFIFSMLNVGIVFPFFIMGALSSGGSVGVISILPLLGIILIPPLVILFITTIWALSARIILGITGQASHSFTHTFRCLCYSYGANIFSATPCLGIHLSFISWIWWAVSAILMIKDSHKVSGPRASFAVLTFPILALIGIIALITFSVYTGINAANNAMNTMANGMTQTITDGMIAYADDHNGQLPKHAASLVMDEYLDSMDFIIFTPNSIQNTIVFDDVDIDSFQMMSQNEQEELLEKAIEQLPNKITAHRMGSYVFTYHGINLKNADPKLWIAIQAPMKTTSPGYQPFQTSIAIALADGSVISIPNKDFPAALEKQNQLRATFKLPPIPDPQTITHDQPAISQNR